jgi:hypothetical protein
LELVWILVLEIWSLPYVLFLNIREKTHEPSCFDRGLNGTLLLCRQSGAFPTHKTAVGADELFQQINVFVIHVLDIVLCENVVGHNDTAKCKD